MNDRAKELKVLMVSSDRNILVPGSAVAERMKGYAQGIDALHIVVLCDAAHGLHEVEIGKNAWAYPTNSSSRFLRPFGGASLGQRIVREKGFVRGKSVITAQDPFECGWAALSIKRQWRLPLEVQLHTDPFSPYFSGALNRVRKAIASRVLRNADTVRAVSGEVASKLGQRFGLTGKTVVLPIAVDVEKITSGHMNFDLHGRYGWRSVLLSVARLEPEKNLPFAIRALALIRQRYPDTGLVVVGSGSEEKSLRALAKKLRLESFVQFVGWQDELFSFYKSADVFIQTSRFEGYGLALVEAGLNGLAAVSTAVGIVNELTNGKELYIVDHDDDQSLAAAVCDILENNFKRENMRLNMKNTLESKLASKEIFHQELLRNWEKTALLVR